ncbi:hypothetical protein [Clostridium cuniculi]|uniref:hypothetical protein n=1 Tax=Clostridium cuniculi TaxID=2548455 RepID=UPI00140F6748|nr:hypothetical protein [Clostridium cuniculi]
MRRELIKSNKRMKLRGRDFKEKVRKEGKEGEEERKGEKERRRGKEIKRRGKR